MKADEIKKVEEKILAEINKIQKLEKSEFTTVKNASPRDSLEITQNENCNLFELKLDWRNALYLNKLFDSLNKIESNQYGKCEECEDEIGLSRLLARPTAKLCHKCKEESEQSDNKIIYQKRSKTSKYVRPGNNQSHLGVENQNIIEIKRKMTEKASLISEFSEIN